MEDKKEVVEAKSFQEKMKDRVREGIGDLITDEELKVLIESGIRDVFFKEERVVPTQRFGSATYKPSVIESVLREELGSKMEPIMREWCDNNSKELLEMVKSTIDRDMSEVVLASVNSMFRATMDNFKFSIQNDIQNITQNQY